MANISIQDVTYETDISDKQTEFRAMSENMRNGYKFHVVRIQTETDIEVCNARVWGTQDMALKTADTWLRRLCIANPGKLLKYSVTDIRPQ